MPQKITRKPPRFHQDDATYFLTFSTFRRRKILHSPGIPEMLIDALKFYSQRIRELIAYTIMVDHVHLMIEIDRVSEMSAFLRDFKKWTAKEISRMTGYSAPIWLRGTMDHCVRNDRDYQNHLAYIFYNCWKHLRVKPRVFRYHNFHEFVDKGIFDIDFLGLDRTKDLRLENHEA